VMSAAAVPADAPLTLEFADGTVKVRSEGKQGRLL